MSANDPTRTSDALFRAQVPTGAIRAPASTIASQAATLDRGIAAMNEPETGEASEAARGNSDLQKELADVLRQRAAISAVLRAIANSPHDLQPIFDTIVDNAVHLCRAEGGGFRIPAEGGFRLVSFKLSPAWSEMNLP